MNRCDKIWRHPSYQQYYKQIEACEQDRIFCHHDMVHFLDVARIGWIIALEEQIPVEKELLYGAALLHDIGRHKQYLEKIPHEQASAELAPEILADCGFDKMEQDVIVDAIRNHRNKEIAREKTLRGILYRADKKSRSCFCCKAEPECDWSAEKKNLQLMV